MGSIRDIFTFFFSLFCVIVFSFVLYMSLFNDMNLSDVLAIIFLVLILLNGILILFGFKNCTQWQSQFAKKVSIIAVVLLSFIWIVLYFIT